MTESNIMKILIDLTSLADNFSGIERFALSITQEMIQEKDNEYILVFKRDVHPSFTDAPSNVTKVIIGGKHKLISAQILLPLKLYQLKADAYFFPAFPAPFFFFNKKVCNTIHDLSCWDCPESNKRYMLWYFKIMYWKASLCNKKIITVSEFSKGRICEILKVKSGNVFVVYNGISPQFDHSSLSNDEKKRVVEKYQLPDNYVLCLSTLEPRKNLRLMLDAYASLFEDGAVQEIVLAGRKGWRMEDFLKGYKEDFLRHVHFTGFVEDKDLPAVYKLANIFVFPSFYEGFGIPPLEALACGVPVISSDAASMPEILDNHAFYFKSNDLCSLKKAITEVKLSDFNEQEAVLYAHKYRWSQEAGKVKKVLEKV